MPSMGSAGLRWRLPETVIDMDRCTMGYEIVAQIPVPGLRSEVERCPTVGVLMRWYVQEGGWVQGRMYLFFDVHPKRGYVMGHEEAFAALLLAASVVQRRPAWSKKHVVSPVLLGTDIDALHPLCCPLLLASRQPQPRSDFSVAHSSHADSPRASRFSGSAPMLTSDLTVSRLPFRAVHISAVSCISSVPVPSTSAPR